MTWHKLPGLDDDWQDTPIVQLQHDPTEYSREQLWIMLQWAQRGPLLVVASPDRA